MKKSLKRILIIAVAVLMICAAVVVAIVASDVAKQNSAEVELKIYGANLSFSDSVYIKYAIDYKNVDIEDITMLIWTEPQTEYVKGTEKAVLSNGYVDPEVGDYVIFDYKELAAKQMTDVVYARAYVKVGNTEYYSAPKKYSILQYAYNMMGKTSSPSSDEKLIALLADMLNYGALAQKYTNYKTDTLATDEFVQVKLSGGTFEDGFNHGLYKVGTSLTITAPTSDEDFSFVGWRNSAGEIVSSNANYTVVVGETNELYTALYQGNTSDKLQYALNSDGITYSVSGIGECADTAIVVPSVVGSKLITGIEDGAFKDCADIKSITLSSNITRIGANAFSGCTSLESVYFKGVKSQWEAVKKGDNWNGGNTSLKIFWEKSSEDWELGGVPLN